MAVHNETIDTTVFVILKWRTQPILWYKCYLRKNEKKIHNKKWDLSQNSRSQPFTMYYRIFYEDKTV